MSDSTTTIDEVFARGPVIAVLQFENVEQAISVCRAAQDGGIRTIEVLLRTPAALAAIEAVAALDGLLVGAGTVVDPSQFGDAVSAGARFAVSPGFTPALADAAARHAIAWLPGAMTPSEILAARSAGYRRLKFFPAEAAGGVPALSAIAGPFADVSFCPTGGIRAENAAAYLALPNVACVGGAWIAPRELVAARDWTAIATLARAACALGDPV